MLPQTARLPPYPTSFHDFTEAQRAGLLWVVRSQAHGPVGFALCEYLGDNPHLEELDVLPEHGRRGLGSRLVRTVCAWAESLHRPLTLTTFRDVPWNCRWDERLGFRVLSDAELTAPLRARIDEETAAGLPPDLRVAMCYEPGGTAHRRRV